MFRLSKQLRSLLVEGLSLEDGFPFSQILFFFFFFFSTDLCRLSAYYLELDFSNDERREGKKETTKNGKGKVSMDVLVLYTHVVGMSSAATFPGTFL